MSNLDHRRNAAESDRRRTARFIVEVPARIRTVIGDRECRISNISDHGARIETEEPPPAGIAACLIMGDEEIFCTVKWSKEGGCGVEFDHTIGPHTLEALATRAPVEAGPIANRGRIQMGQRRSSLVTRED